MQIMPLDRTPQKDNPAMSDKEAEANKNRRRTMTLSEKKDDDNCGHCLKIVRKGISCDDCEKWYHRDVVREGCVVSVLFQGRCNVISADISASV